MSTLSHAGTGTERRSMFTARYASGDMPWDSGITPPEILEHIALHRPGWALDIGCGTGTVLRDLLQAGWRVDGVDFVPRALELAARKLAPFAVGDYSLHCGDAANLGVLPLRACYGLIIDIGCGHSLPKARNPAYAAGIIARLAAGGTFMLYASQPRAQSDMGWTSRQVAGLFGTELHLHWEQRGENRAVGGAAVSWYCWQRRGEGDR